MAKIPTRYLCSVGNSTTEVSRWDLDPAEAEPVTPEELSTRSTKATIAHRPGYPQAPLVGYPQIRRSGLRLGRDPFTVVGMLSDWLDKADNLERKLPKVGRCPASGLVRRARRLKDLSQRQMATMARGAPSTVGRVESGVLTPSLDLLQRLLATAGLYLVVVDQDGRVIMPMRECEETTDGAGRRYPSHLDTILDPEPGEWWADEFGLARPPETFDRDRRRRDEMRARSRWEVRAKLLRRRVSSDAAPVRVRGAGA